MDAYQEVMVKLLEVTEGKDSKAVDFKDLVKKLGFHGNYGPIFERLSQEGWIAEDRKADFVRITHWGVAEAKKALKQAGGAVETPTSENASKCAATAREFATVLHNFAKDASKENLKKAENKFAELETAFNLAKKDAQ
jgi:hypothetical protein